jgi:hypothetical protein
VPVGVTVRQFGIKASDSYLYISGKEGIRGKEYSNIQRQFGIRAKTDCCLLFVAEKRRIHHAAKER